MTFGDQTYQLELIVIDKGHLIERRSWKVQKLTLPNNGERLGAIHDSFPLDP